jgi:hypothetical protein
MKLIAAKEWNKVFQKDGFKHRIKVRAELESLGGQTPRFSITGQIDRQAKNNRWMEECGGCIHEEILQQFPQLKPLVEVHLSDENGVPMHAYANAAYWAGYTKYQKRDIAKLAKHLRVTEWFAKDLIGWLEHHYGTDFDEVTTSEMAWAGTCAENDLLEQWENQAKLAKSMLNAVEEISA